MASQASQAMQKYLAEQLCTAVRHGDMEALRMCLAAGAAADGRDQHGWTALHYGVCYSSTPGHLEACEALLEAGCDLEVQLPDLSTPLMLAAEEGHLEVARLLLERGARTEQKDEDGFTALDRCEAAAREEFAELLQRRHRESPEA